MPGNVRISEIDRNSRIRDAKEYGDVSALASSIKAQGMIQPIVLARDKDGKLHLIAGGRRMAACDKLKLEELTYAQPLVPGTATYVLVNDVDTEHQLEAEIDENLFRKDLSWQDNAKAVARLHQLKREKHGTNKWGTRQTAELLGKGFGKANVSYAVRVAKELEKGDKEILACKSLTEALGVLVKRKSDAAVAELQRRAANQAERQANKLNGPAQPVGTPAATSSFLDSLTVDTTKPTPKAPPSVPPPVDPVVALLTAVAKQDKPKESTPPIVIPLSKMFVLGDSIGETIPQHTSADALRSFRRRYMASLPDMFFDHIVTDIPYGIDMDNLSSKDLADVADQHEVEANVDLMLPFLEQSFRLLKPSGFCVFFYDLDHHEKLQSWAASVGFRVQRWPLIWSKTHNCRNQAAQYNTTKDYEVAMILRKDSTTVLRKPQLSSLWRGDGAAERKQYGNKFAKPFELWKFVYDMIALPGQTVFDPYCGEMSGPRAAANCGLVPFGCEINETHFNRGLAHMRALYKTIHKDNVVFE